jgi:hypothetical protein
MTPYLIAQNTIENRQKIGFLFRGEPKAVIMLEVAPHKVWRMQKIKQIY